MASQRGISHEEAKQAIDELVQRLEQNFTFRGGYKINEIVKAGSLGHGTAVLGDFDVDLVIYSVGVTVEQIERAGYRYYLEQLDTFLKSQLPHGSYVQNEMERQSMYKFRSIQFRYRGYIDVDLLVSPYWKDQFELYRFLMKASTPEDYTVFAAKWQVQFFKHRPQEVKEFIRRAKAWRNKKWPTERGGDGKPSSYLMSLLVLKAYERGGSQRVTEELKTIVRGQPDIYWEEYYQRRNYPQHIPSRPRIIDPANPMNNVWTNGFRSYKPNEKISDYKPGDGNAFKLRQYIDSIDLSKVDGMATGY